MRAKLGRAAAAVKGQLQQTFQAIKKELGHHPNQKILAIGFASVLALMGTHILITSRAATIITSSGSGSWSNASTWGGVLPQPGDSIVIAAGHIVTLDVTSPVTVSGITIQPNATLVFDPYKSTTIQSNANIIVNGKLVMKPASPTIFHALQFVGINERNFAGGGMDPLASDVGLWVMGDGQLDIQGINKTAWNRLNGAAAQGATSVTLEMSPSGWAVGDEISIAPTEPPTVGDRSWYGFDLRTITAISGNAITVNAPLEFSHPMVNGQWKAEVMNLTRNVKIEGTQTGRSHIFIRSTKPQVINHAGVRFMGPRRDTDGDGKTEFALGRYGIHFHMNFDGSRGSQVIGTVVRDTASHAYVAHESQGTNFINNISFNTAEDAFWWDGSKDTRTPGSPSNDTLFDGNIAALVYDLQTSDRYRLAGFSLGAGENNVARNNVAVGVRGDVDASGFKWTEESDGLWDFSQGNMSHNNKVDGIFAWQNSDSPHVISNFIAYHNMEKGIDHGAYANAYHYENTVLYGNRLAALDLRAISNAVGEVRFDNVTFDGANISQDLVLSFDHTFDGTARPTIFRNSTFRNATNAFRIGTSERNLPDAIHVEYSTISTPADVVIEPNAPAGSVARIQPNATSATEITAAGRRSIPVFANFKDASPPESSIINPIGGAVVSGIVPISTISFDYVGITKVEFYVDGQLKGIKTSAPFTFTWDTTGLTNSSPHNLQLKSYDAAGNTNNSNVVTAFIGNDSTLPPISPPPAAPPPATPPPSTPPPSPTDTPPTVSITSPVNGATVAGSINVTANATDNVGVSKVSFFIDDVIIGNDSIGSDGWSHPWNTATTANSSHSVKAVAYDTANQSSASTITVTVNNQTTTPPPATPPPTTPPPTTPPPPPPTITTGQLAGTVRSSNGQVLAGAKVSLTVNGSKRTVVTNSFGQYGFSNLPAGNYTVKYAAQYHITQEQTITVTSGNTTTRDVVLTRR